MALLGAELFRLDLPVLLVQLGARVVIVETMTILDLAPRTMATTQVDVHLRIARRGPALGAAEHSWVFWIRTLTSHRKLQEGR